MRSPAWQRPKTTRVYFHPPMSERMYTLWREGKVIFGDNTFSIREEYFDIVSSGIRFLFGDGELDFKENEYRVREDGVPIHSLVGSYGGIGVTLTVYATPGRDSAAYIKLRLENKSDTEESCRVGFMLRTAKETSLVLDAPDVYCPYRSDLDEWRALKSCFELRDGKYLDGERTISLLGEIDFAYNRDTGSAFSDISLGVGESLEAVFVYSRTGAECLSPEAAYDETVAYWLGELGRIKNLPDGIKNDPHALATVRNLTAQMLQCFCHIIDTDYVFARQGGLQRQVWPFETMPVLESLSLLGDFDSYIEPVIDLYFNAFYTESGEMVPLGIHWAMATGTVLYSFANYAMKRGREFYLKYRDKAMRSFEWIRDTRRSVKGSEALVEGLFPPMSSCDDPLVFQSWTNTDSFTLMGVAELASAAEKFADKRAPEIREEYNSYLGAMSAAWREYVATQPECDEIDVPYSPKGDNDEIAKRFAFTAADGYLVDAIDMPMEDAMRVVRFRTRRGIIRGGLYNRMPNKAKSTGSTIYNLDENGRCDVWYLSAHEFSWFLYFLRHGMRERCAEIVRDNEYYGMTEEYYMLERCKESNPYFTPWMPNASANGRTIIMMLEFFA